MLGHSCQSSFSLETDTARKLLKRVMKAYQQRKLQETGFTPNTEHAQFGQFLWCSNADICTSAKYLFNKLNIHHHHHLSLHREAPQMISQPVSTIFPCSLLPSGTWRTQHLSIPWCCLPTSSSVCFVFFPLSLCLARWFWPDLMNGRHDHTEYTQHILKQFFASWFFFFFYFRKYTHLLLWLLPFQWNPFATSMATLWGNIAFMLARPCPLSKEEMLPKWR